MEDVEAHRRAVEDRLREVLEAVEPPELREEVEAAALAGGKRVRPTLAMLCCEAVGGEASDALDYAVGVELVHNASLVVDDIIDRSDLRRGEPSAWAAYGHGPAIVASDGLLGEAFALFSDDARASETAADSLVELGQGEATELVDQPSNESEYMELARRKTGALFRAAAELGAIAADADTDTVDAFGEYAERVGVAFQLRDDVLDVTAETGELGKPAGTDEEMDRPSVLRVTDRSVEGVNALADAESEAAVAALEDATVEAGAAREYMERLAAFVVERER
ncbi:LOW QUALITY PROTEIN: octaprenyl diphosphate synthase / Dimethylallyltransferase / Geranyltranstransferase / Geranylgeranyl diphosphate synthase [Halarchaeum acidiphilum MH1-52-1]|uniref:Octaprenyl diphosphate synthase / Dimethylallyltransferase / Geranyltranstransferase / Geranylgeranyl diphosphate synthase n=1 Tax=Halarchaeum acidiphilum MH1-52-1 TaxID=1261545 RepID=U3AB74_9EURY|nr:LOW QUALITY PROTEIN: octaprenyl diphosphate synthase / Dimethylallyltransferase / Geranyltranstransferase / Geranylgeranyl diphosphate synthase [Halarchaeum acidiphilum MH1-52-1]